MNYTEHWKRRGAGWRAHTGEKRRSEMREGTSLLRKVSTHVCGQGQNRALGLRKHGKQRIRRSSEILGEEIRTVECCFANILKSTGEDALGFKEINCN